MIEDFDLEPLDGLPPELAALDAELRDLRVAERSSFGPELKAELERRWARGVVPPANGWSGRRAMAAAIGGLFFVGLAVPPARASLAELSRQSLRFLGVVDAAAPPAVEAHRPETPRPGVPLALPSTEEAEEPTSIVRRDETATEALVPPTGLDVDDLASPPPFRPPVVTFPELVDREADQVAIRKYYPPELLTAGVGGIVKVRLTIDSLGHVDEVTLARGSGQRELDRAAMLAAHELRFRPGTRAGRPVAHRVEFEMLFDPRVAPPELPVVPPVDEPRLTGELTSELPPAWSGEAVVPSPIGVEAQELLRAALGDDPGLLERLGSLESLLEGAPPAGMAPLAWRTQATSALQEAMVRDPDNPAPYLALARIRQRQGLHPEARTLLERGIDRARRGVRATSPQLVAELNYEMGLLLSDAWLGWRGLGRIAPDALDPQACPGARDPGDDDVWGVVEALVGWNYLCPAELDRAWSAGFESVAPPSDLEQAMSDAFESAVEAYPAHRGANVALLLDLADQERWYELLGEARMFAHASAGHPYALLLSGVALHRIGWPEEAMGDFEKALARLPDSEVARLRDPRPLMTPDQRADLDALGGADADESRRAFWASVDPIVTTAVNEREVEHLARATYATLRFGSLEADPSLVWLRYGRPLRIRTLGANTALRTEFWDYGTGPDVTFRRPAMSPDLDLTPEARSYLGDLEKVFPQWYGNRARAVSRLPAQVARFRGSEPSEREIQVHTSVPEAFATGGSDSLELAVVVQAADGNRLARTTLRIPATLSVVRLPRVRARGGADRVIVELFHPGLSQVVGLRIPVAPEGGDATEMRASELLLTESPRMLDRLDPADPPVEALTSDEVSGEQVGIFFEVYDVPEPGGSYGVAVELEPVEGGSGAIPVRIRPAGARDFLSRWTRSAAEEEGVISEHMAVDLADVPPGSYVLRVRIDVDGKAPLLVTRPVLRR